MSGPKIERTKGSQSEIGMIYQYGVTALLAGGLSSSKRVEDYVIYSSEDSAGKFDDVIAKVKLKDDAQWYLSLIQVKYKEEKKLNVNDNLKEKPKGRIVEYFLSDYIRSLSKILDDPTTRCRVNIPTENIRFGIFCNKEIQAPVFIRDECTFLLKLREYQEKDEISQILLPFGVNSWKFYCDDLKYTEEFQRFFDTCTLCLKKPNYNEINRHIQNACGIDNAKDIVNYVKDYFNNNYLYEQGLTKVVFDLELQKIRLHSFMPPLTTLADLVEDIRIEVWNRITSDHDLTIVNNSDDIEIENCLYGCLLRKLNILLEMEIDWKNYVFTSKDLHPDIVTHFLNYSKNQKYRCWVNVPNTLKGLIAEVWKYGQLPLILRMGTEFKIFEMYSHLNRNYILIDDLTKLSDKIANSKLKIFSCISDVNETYLKDCILNMTRVSLQGRLDITLKNLLDDDEELLSTFTAAHIIDLMKDRTAYLKEEYLAGTKNLAFVVRDNTDPEIRVCRDSPAIGSNVRFYCPASKLEQCFVQIENDPNYEDYKICQLQWIGNDLKLIRHDRYKFVCCFVDQYREPVYNSEDNTSVPVIGQIVVLQEPNYVPRCLTKSTISLSYFNTREKQICLLSGDIASMDVELEYEQVDIDAIDAISLTEKKTYFIRVNSEGERQIYWSKLSGVGCPIFDIKVLRNGEMQIMRCRGSKNLGSSVSYKGERITQQVLFEEMKNERDNIIIVTGEAGVGKSTLLKSLCDSCDPRYYILLYDLINFQVSLHENENPLNDPLDYIFKSFHAGISKRYNQFLHALRKKSRFILLFDSFDEIISTCEKQVIDFIQRIISTGVQIIIASRFKSSNILLDKFNARTIRVDPLSDEEYLENWKLKREAFANVRAEFRSPLYLNLLKLISVSHEQLPNVTKLTLFEKVVNIKIGSWLKRNNRVLHDSEIDRAVTLFERLALVAMFGKEEIEDGLRWLCDRTISDCTKYGVVVRFDEGAAPIFYHYTFVEYFVSQWIFKAMQTKMYRSFARYLYKRLFDEGKMYALNVISEDVPLHRAILQTNVEEMEEILQVEAPNCWDITDRLGRSPLHAAIISCGSAHDLESAYFILKKVMDVMLSRPEIMEKGDFVMNWGWADYIQAKILQDGCCYKTLPFVETYFEQQERNHRNQCNNGSIFPLKKFQEVFKEALGFLSSDIISRLLQLQNLQNRKFSKFQRNGLNESKRPSKIRNGFKCEGDLSPLHVASIYGNLHLMENLIRENADVNAIDKFDCTPLHYILMGSTSVNTDGLKLLLKNGAHVDLQHPSNRNSVAPIIIAVCAKDTEAVRILLENGANPNIRDGNFDSPLHIAAREGSYDIVECLLDYNANPNLKNRNGKTVLDVADVENNENIIRLLKERFGSVVDVINAADDNSHSLLTITAKIKRIINSIERIKSEDVKVDFNRDDDEEDDDLFSLYDYCNDFRNINSFLDREHSNSLSLLSVLNEMNIKSNPMNLARLFLKNETIELILRTGSNLHTLGDDDGCTLLHIVAGEGDQNLTKILIEKQQVEINIQDRQGFTPLHHASIRNRLNIAKLLLAESEGANPNLKDNNGDTPLHLSVGKNYFKMTELLLRNGAVCNIGSNDGRTPLYFAILNNIPHIVKLLLDNGAEVHTFDNNGLTPLHYAAMNGNLDVLQLLLEKGADVNIEEANEVLPLMCAIYKGKFDAVTTLILDGKANIDLSDKSGNLPFHVAIDRRNIEIVKFLLNNGAKVNVTNKDGITPLYCATYKKQVDIVDLLLERGADINARNQNLETSLHCAVATTRLDIVKILLDKKSDPDLQDSHGKTPLHFAATNGYVDIVKILLEYFANINLTDEDGITALHCAVFTGRNEIVKLLIDAGAVVDVREKCGRTALYTAVEEGNMDLVKLLLEKQQSIINIRNAYDRTPLHCALIENHIEIATFLLDEGAPIDVRDKNGDTPLHLAAKLEDADIVAKLLENGANINAVNKDDTTPLYYASQEGHLDVARLLLNREAEVNVQDYRGNTALHIATIEANTEIVKLLMTKGADANIRNTNGNTPLHYATEKGLANIVRLLLLNDKTDTNLTGKHGNTPLHTATGKGCTYIVRTLLEKGVHPSTVNQHGCTALHYATEEGYSEIVRLLLDGNASPNVRDKLEDTPLHIAVNKGSVEIVNMLLCNGANVNFDDQYGGTPLHSATSKGRIDIVQLLLDKRGNPNSQNDNGDTPLHLSLLQQQHRTDIFEILMEKGGDLTVHNRTGFTPLHYAAFHGRLDTVKAHLEADVCEKIGSSLLYCAVIGRREDFIRELLEKGANLNGSDTDGVTPLHCAVFEEDADSTTFLLGKGAEVNTEDKYGNTPLHIAVNRGCVTLIKLLLDSKANIDCSDKNGVNPLHIGAFKGFMNVVELLLDNDANIDARDTHQENTALHICAEAGHADIFKLLLEKGAGPSFYNKEGITPFHYAAAKGHANVIEESSLDAEILMNIPDVNDNTLLHTAANCGRDSILELLLKDDVDVNVLNRHGSTPLHFAVYSNRSSSVKLLLDKQVDVNIKDKGGNTALHLAVVQGNLNMIRLLLGKGADLNMPDIEGNTPLHFSVFSANSIIIELLIENGAKADISSNNQTTPLHIAVRRKREDIIQLLLPSNKTTNVNVQDAEGNTVLHLTLTETPNEAYTQTFLSNRDTAVFKSYENSTIESIRYKMEDEHIDIRKLLSHRDANVQTTETNESKSNSNVVRNTEIIYKTETDQVLTDDDEDDDDDDTIIISYAFPKFNEDYLTGDALYKISKLTDKNGNAISTNIVPYLPFIELSKAPIRAILNRELIPITHEKMNIPVNVSICIKRKDISKLFLELQSDGKSYQHFNCNYNLDCTNPFIKLFLFTKKEEEDDNNKGYVNKIFIYGVDKSKESSGVNEPPIIAHNKFDILNVIQLFLDNGANVNIQNKTGNSPLHLAVENGNMEILNLLLRNKCNINVTNENGVIPLHQAISSAGQNIDLIRLLVDRGADVNFRDRNGKTPFQLASETGNLDIVGLLLAKGAKASMESVPHNT